MSTFIFAVTVQADSLEDAQQVLSERLDCDDYETEVQATIFWNRTPAKVEVDL